LVREAYQWLLPLVNPYLHEDVDFQTNCVIAAIAVDMSLEEGQPHQAPGSGAMDAATIFNYARSRNRPYIGVNGGFAPIEGVMQDAPPGSRALIVFPAGVLANLPSAHAINVVRDPRLGPVFLDGQLAMETDLSREFGAGARPFTIMFIPTAGDIRSPGVALDSDPKVDTYVAQPGDAAAEPTLRVSLADAAVIDQAARAAIAPGGAAAAAAVVRDLGGRLAGAIGLLGAGALPTDRPAVVSTDQGLNIGDMIITQQAAQLLGRRISLTWHSPRGVQKLVICP
jgi:hypothetical protein